MQAHYSMGRPPEEPSAPPMPITHRWKERTMRGLMLFVAGIVVGLAVQTTVAQTTAPGVPLNHVGIAVPSIPDAAAFYIQKMGFREAFRNSDAQGNPTAIYIQVSKGTFIELQQATAQRPAGINHFGMEVPDIQRAVAFFKARGAMATEPGSSERVLESETGKRHRPERPPHRARRARSRVAPTEGDGELEIAISTTTRQRTRSISCDLMRALGAMTVVWLLTRS